MLILLLSQYFLILTACPGAALLDFCILTGMDQNPSKFNKTGKSLIKRTKTVFEQYVFLPWTQRKRGKTRLQVRICKGKIDNLQGGFGK